MSAPSPATRFFGRPGRTSRRRAVALTELLVVLVVIGALAAVVAGFFPALKKTLDDAAGSSSSSTTSSSDSSSDSSTDSSHSSDLRHVLSTAETQAEAYYSANSQWPAARTLTLTSSDGTAVRVHLQPADDGSMCVEAYWPTTGQREFYVLGGNRPPQGALPGMCPATATPNTSAQPADPSAVTTPAPATQPVPAAQPTPVTRPAPEQSAPAAPAKPWNWHPVVLVLEVLLGLVLAAGLGLVGFGLANRPRVACGTPAAGPVGSGESGSEDDEADATVVPETAG